MNETTITTTLPADIATTKLTKKNIIIDDIFKPNEEGISEWVSRDTLSTTTIALSNNGNCRHGIFFGDNRYIWEKQMTGRSISAIRTNGFNEDYLLGHARPIRTDIDKHHKQMGCVVCGSHSDLVTDHKNDLYNDPRVLHRDTQTIDDFQCLCNHCNLQKRQVAIKTRETKKRIGATTIPSLAVFGTDFSDGDETYDEKDVNAMVGTYWHDPVAFMQYINIFRISID